MKKYKRNHRNRKLLLAVILLLLAGVISIFLQGVKTYALAKTIPAKGKEGKCNWKIDSKGKLTITINGDYAKPTEGLDEYEHNNFYYMIGHLEPEWCDYNEQIRSVKVKKGKGKLANTIGMFYNFNVAPEKYDLRELDTSSVTDMTAMFMRAAGAPNLGSLDTSKVKSMKYMFCNSRMNEKSSGCLKGVDTSYVTDLSHMFQGASYVPDLRKLKFPSAETTAYMFASCCLEGKSMEHIKRLDTSNVENMTSMFADVRVDKLDLEGYDTSNARIMDRMFERYVYMSAGGPKEPVELNLSSFQTAKVESMERMFECYSKLTTLDLSSFDMRNVKNMNYMFYKCKKLETLYITPEKWSNLTKSLHAGGVFEECGLSYGGKFQGYLRDYTVRYDESEEEFISPVLNDYFTPQTK